MRSWSHNRQLSVGFISLGCAKNLVDSEIIATGLLRAGFALAAAPEKSDVLIINTCAFIRDAKTEAVETILEGCELKRRGRPQYLIVAGCLPQRYRQELKDAFPEVDAFIGLDQLNRVAAIIARLRRGAQGILEISPVARARVAPPANRILFTAAPYAYLKIAEGCNHHCSFCAIPRIRGRFRSRSLASIVQEAEDLLARGVRELNLIAQDTTAYGLDLGRPADLALLLRQIGKIGGKFWVRLLYGHPGHITRRLLRAMAETEQVCRYLDIPIQHCVPEVLRQMGRGGGATELRRLIRQIRSHLPDVALRTTGLVGFPGETDVFFRRLLNFIGEIRFDHLGVFIYSAEDGTRAAALPAKVPRAIARQRKDMLMRRQQKIVAEKLARLIGKKEEIFIEKRKDKAQYIWQARSRRQAPETDSAVYLRDRSGQCRPGMLVRARYLKPAGYDLIAEIENQRN